MADKEYSTPALTPEDAILPVSSAAAVGSAIAGSKYIDRKLINAGIESKMPGARLSDVRRFFRIPLMHSADALENYADISSAFLNRDIVKGISGRKLLKAIGNAMYSTGSDIERKMPILRGLGRVMKGQGAHFRADFKHPHFNGFPTPGAGVRTLINEKANWGGLSLENMGHIARESLEASGWKADRKAARLFDRKFRDLIQEGYNFRPIRYSNKDILPILEAIAKRHKPGTSARVIANGMMPGADASRSLYDAVKPVLSRTTSSKNQARGLSKSIAGRLSILAAAGTARKGSIQHGTELAALNTLKILRSKGFRRGAAVAGMAGAIPLAQKIINNIRQKGHKK